MAQTIKLKRSSVSGRVPTTSDLELGEVAINTYDGKMYIKKSVGGTETIVSVGGGALATAFTLYEYTATSGQTTFSGSDGNSNALAYDTGTPPKILVYLNGVLLDHSTDYTATNGTSVVLTNGAATNDLLQIAAYKSTVTSDQNLDLDDNQKILLGDDDDLQLYHDGTDNLIRGTGGDMYIRQDVDDKDIILQSDDGSGGLADYIRLDGSNTRTIMSQNVLHQDDIRAFFGSGNDLAIYHDGTSQDGFIINNTEDLIIRNDADDKDVIIQADNGSGGRIAYFRADGSTGEAKLLHYGNLKLTTQSGGVLITGELESDSLDVNGAADISGNLTVQAGDAGTSAYSVTSNGGDLVLKAGADDVVLRTGGSGSEGIYFQDGAQDTKMFINAEDGNVGIGTTSPTKALDVRSGTTDVVANFQSSDALALIAFQDDSTSSANAVQLGAVGDDLRIDTGDVERVRINSSGEVGIGTNNIDEKLHVQGSVNNDDVAIKIENSFDDDSASSAPTAALVFSTASNNGHVRVFGAPSDSAAAHQMDIGSTASTSYLTFSPSGSERMRIDSSGNVGIGVTDPAAKLEVKRDSNATNGVIVENTTTGTAARSNVRLISDAAQLDIYATSSTYSGVSSWADAGVISTASSASGGLIFNAQTTGHIFQTGTNERMRIPSTGGVSIGTTTAPGSGGLLVDNDIKTNSRIGIGSAGNTSTPALYNNSDADTGVYWPAANTLGFVTGGTERARITSSGHLDINGNNLIDVNQINGVDGSGWLDFNMDTDSVYPASTTDNQTVLGSITHMNFVGDSNGNGTGGIFYWGYGVSNTDSGTFTQTMALDRSGNLTLTGALRGPATFTIDPAAVGDNTGTVVIAGNLQVDGTTTTINSTTLTVDDKNITLASGSTNAAAANGAGLTVDCGSDTDATFTYDGTNDEWDFNKNLKVSGSVGVTNIVTNKVVKFNGTILDDSIITDNGTSVGISQSSPSSTYKLDVAGAIRSAAAAPSFALQETDSSNQTWLFASYSGTAAIRDVTGSTYPLQIEATTPSNTLYLDSNGRVGIGTTSPSHQLHVAGAGDIVIEDTGGGSSHLRLKSSASGSTTSHWKLKTNAANNFYIDNDQQGTSNLTILSGGNVGIGTSSPSAKFQIEEAGIDTTTTSTTATTQVAIDTFAAATFRSARYTIQVTNSTDSTYHLTEILLIHDGTTPQITEFGTIFTGSAEATFDADISSGNVRLLATPATTDSMTFKVVRHCITV